MSLMEAWYNTTDMNVAVAVLREKFQILRDLTTEVTLLVTSL